jgi:hypothetical protein
LSDTVKKATMGVKRMGIILWCVTAICYLSYLSKPATGEVPTAVIVTAMTLIAAMGGVDKWKQVMDAR